jgi:sulfur carrier protein
MLVIVNGKQRETNAAHVEALLDELEYASKHLAVAINYDVVPRARWASAPL